MVGNQANHMTNYKENVMQATTVSRTPRTLGTLTVSMPLTIPRTSQPSAVKQSTLVRWSYIDLEQAKELKEQFLAKNDELNPSFLEFKWTPCPVKL
jgi:hypothetical protein